jgi:hypothetical protein
MVKALDAGLVAPDIVCGPADAEFLVAGGELADDGGEGAVVRVSFGTAVSPAAPDALSLGADQFSTPERSIRP